ncbi:hypothetical protein CEXT_189571 [Caerostris extrusa]|uniref:Uncharacterized protein n=1 Tax=Caerostris extrusa TaxID=172846 RepID=A0AAV4WZ49_CAEEX|nr:hypothetical protein CEXT_189571 [Caerostris extrusa]
MENPFTFFEHIILFEPIPLGMVSRDSHFPTLHLTPKLFIAYYLVHFTPIYRVHCYHSYLLESQQAVHSKLLQKTTLHLLDAWWPISTCKQYSLIRAFTNTIRKDPTIPIFEYVYTYTRWTIIRPFELKIVELRLEDLFFLKEVKKALSSTEACFLFVFSVDNVSSAYRLERIWIACMKKAMGPDVSSALVCSKIDLRSHPF